jgi:hypothetical protein
MSWRRTKTAPGVRDGRTLHKNNWRPTPDNYGQPQVTISRLRPGTGYRHVLRCSDVYTFVHLLPDWARLKTRLNQILLAPGESRLQGWFRPGTVAICAMHRDLGAWYHRDFFALDVDFFDRVGVPYQYVQEDGQLGEHPSNGDWQRVRVQFTPALAHCFQLVRVLTHELGHHYDRITNPRGWASRGEPFAIRYERETEAAVWARYVEVFGDPRR